MNSHPLCFAFRSMPGFALLGLMIAVSTARAQSEPGDSVHALPEPLRFVDGREVKTQADWEARRKELIGLYENHVFGRMPTVTQRPTVEVLTDVPDARGGLARRRDVRIYLIGDKAGPWMDLLLYTPAAATGKVPAFLGLNYLGNQSVTDEPDVRITTSWITQSRGGLASWTTGRRRRIAARSRGVGPWTISFAADMRSPRRAITRLSRIALKDRKARSGLRSG